MTQKLSILKGAGIGEERKFILSDGVIYINDIDTLEKYASKCLDIIRDAKIVEYTNGRVKAVKGEDYIADMPDIKTIAEINDAEVFATKTQAYIVPISYVSGFRKNDITRPTSYENTGLGLRIVFDDGKIAYEGARMIFTEDSLLGLLGIAYRGRVLDPDFRGLPAPIKGEQIDLGQRFYDEAVIDLNDAGAIALAHRVFRGALNEYKDALKNGTFAIEKNTVNLGPLAPPIEEILTNVTIHGDIRVTKEMAAVESTTGIKASEMHAGLTGSVMSGYEVASPEKAGFKSESKARGRGSAICLKDFRAEEIGASAARSALKFSGPGERIKDGYYTVFLMPPMVSELMLYVVGPSLTLNDFMFHSIFPLNEVGTKVISKNLSVYDDPHRENSVSSRRMTSEGIPTEKTMLIDKGKLLNYIKDTYHARKYKKYLESRGIDTRPGNGFRLEEGLSGVGHVQPTFTTLVLEGHDTIPLDEMLSGIKRGQKAVAINVGWYSYPINKGYVEEARKESDHSWGSMTSSSPAGSYIVKMNDDGELSKTPIKPNSFRMFAPVRDVLSNVEQVSAEQVTINPWASDHTIVTPTIKADRIYLKNVAKYLG